MKHTITLALALTIAPTTHADHTYPGPEAEAWFGSTVDWAKDSTGRFIVGSPASDANAAHKTGSAFVYHPDSTDPIFIFHGQSNGDRFGSSVAGIADLNNDGVGEWLIGAPGSDHAGPDAGQAYLYCGKTGQLIDTFAGIASDAWFGFSVAHLGDVNGDGISDFAIGARRPSGRGYVRIYSGSDRSILHELTGPQPQTHFGFAVAGAGDVNADGHADFAVSAPFHGAGGYFRGRVYVYSGIDAQLLHTFSGEADFNYFGTALAIPGDVDNDGHADILIGADGYSLPGGGGPNVGRVYVYSGQDGSPLHILTGTESRARFGRGVSAIGDLNNDGHADLLIGQPAPTIFGGTGYGKAFVYCGQTGTILCQLQSPEHDDFFAHALRGNPAAPANQTNILIGAFASNIAGHQSGRVNLATCDVPNPGDLNGDNLVDINDLLILLSQWGACTAQPCPADLNHDNTVDTSDLLLLFTHWGSACHALGLRLTIPQDDARPTTPLPVLGRGQGKGRIHREINPLNPLSQSWGEGGVRAGCTARSRINTPPSLHPEFPKIAMMPMGYNKEHFVQ